MVSNEIAKIERPSTIDKIGHHVAPLTKWGTSAPMERLVAGTKVGVGAVVIAGGAAGAQAAPPIIQAVPYADSGLLLVGAASIVTAGATIAVHRGSETIGAVQISSATRKIAVKTALVAGVAGASDLVLFRGNGPLGQIAGDAAALTGAAAVASAAASLAWARVARREGPNQAA